MPEAVTSTTSTSVELTTSTACEPSDALLKTPGVGLWLMRLK
jgi:hypothetical protein